MTKSYIEARNERRARKQELFTIRRHVEGEPVDLTAELLALKEQYEAADGFTRWEDFPERWDVGDPYGVKQGAYASSAVDERNFARILGKSLEQIVSLEGSD